jgi:flagellar L-ring protein FlgH
MSRAALAAAAVAALLAGCAQIKDARNPQVSAMQLNSKTMPEAASVQVPMPKPQPRPRLVRAEAASLWPNGSRGFFGDQRASRVGDLLTVDIAIADSAKLSNNTKRSRAGSQQLGNPTFLGYGKKLYKILPGIGKSDFPTGSNIADLNSNSSYAGSGSIARGETINLKVAAMVIRKLPNGDMVIAGRQEVKVNRELRELRVAGIIRPSDITTDNTIPYQKIAEARITYGGKGELSSVQQAPYGQDFLNVVLPY